MKIRWGNVVLTSIAMTAGIITLLGYFVDRSALAGANILVEGVYVLRLLLVSWAVLLAAVAICLGAINLGAVHMRKIFKQSRGWPYSLFILLGLLTALAAGFVLPLAGLMLGDVLGLGPGMYSGLGNPLGQWVFRYLQAALGTAISGLIVFFLVFAGFRLLRRPTWRLTSIVFGVVAILSLIGMAPFFLDPSDPAHLQLVANVPLAELRTWLWTWLAQVPAVAGARGLLLGIALGAIATGLRVLLAIDRPYGE
jgi:MFS family permease